MNKQAKTNQNVLIIVAVAIILGIALFGSNLSNISFAIVPPGQYNSNPSCSMITNSAPLEANYNNYRYSNIWIAMDVNADGTKEAFGFQGQGTGSGRVNACGGGVDPTGSLLLENYNAAGDDIYTLYYSPTSEWRLYLCRSDGMEYTYFGQGRNAASNAILTCTAQNTTPTCTPNWQVGSWSSCVSGSQTRTVTDANSCGVIIGKPVTTQSCTVACTPNWQTGTWGSCTAGTQTRTVTDSNSCGITTGQPSTSQACTTTCTPNWVCGSWSSCVNSSQSKTCTDTNSCGLTNPNPTTQSCTIGDTDTEEEFDFGEFFNQYKWWIIGGIGALVIILLLRN